MQALLGILLILFGYLIGSIPSGFWIARTIKGKDFDIRDWGSGNIGATNVLRVLGWKTSLPVFVADFLKGFLPAWVALKLMGEPWAIACMIGAVLGHARSFILYLWEGKFSGGKSVATAFGGIIALQPVVAMSAFIFFMVVLLTTRYLSLSSMISAVFAFLLVILLHKGPFWIWTLLAIALFILYTHLRNISQLLTGQEHKFGKRFAVHGEEGGVRTAFVVHSLDENDLAQSRLSAWILKLRKRGTISARTLRWIVAHSPVFKAGEITGIVDKTGKPATVVVLGIPMLPDQITNPVNKELVESLLKRAAIISQRMGATILGLGALLSSAARGGSKLQQWVKEERRLTITIDNGGAFTAAAAIDALRQVVPNLRDKTVAIVGASGVIGYAIVKYLDSRRDQVGRLLAFGRSTGRLQELAGLADLLDTNAFTELSCSDIVIFATSSPEPIITAENVNLLKPGAVLLDIAVPADVDDRILEIRPDVKLVRCGLIKLPGHAVSPVDLHFGHQLFPACLAQGLLLARTGRYDLASQGVRIAPEVMDWFSMVAKEYGYEVIDSPTDERGVFSGRRTINGR